MSLQQDQEEEVPANTANLPKKSWCSQDVNLVATRQSISSFRSPYTFMQQGSLSPEKDPGSSGKDNLSLGEEDKKDLNLRKDSEDGGSTVLCQSPDASGEQTDDKSASLTGVDLLYDGEQGSTGGIFDKIHPSSQSSCPSPRDGAFVSKFASF